MLAKEGTDGEEEAKKAYKAAREKSDHAAELAAGDRVSSALIDRVRGGLSVAHYSLLFFPVSVEIRIVFAVCDSPYDSLPIIVHPRSTPCSRSSRRRLMMWMLQLAIVGSCWTGRHVIRVYVLMEIQ